MGASFISRRASCHPNTFLRRRRLSSFSASWQTNFFSPFFFFYWRSVSCVTSTTRKRREMTWIFVELEFLFLFILPPEDEDLLIELKKRNRKKSKQKFEFFQTVFWMEILAGCYYMLSYYIFCRKLGCMQIYHTHAAIITTTRIMTKWIYK